MSRPTVETVEADVDVDTDEGRAVVTVRATFEYGTPWAAVEEIMRAAAEDRAGSGAVAISVDRLREIGATT